MIILVVRRIRNKFLEKYSGLKYLEGFFSFFKLYSRELIFLSEFNVLKEKYNNMSLGIIVKFFKKFFVMFIKIELC